MDTARASIPSADLPLGPPTTLTAWGELSTPLEWLRLARGWRALPTDRAPESLPVVLLPGLGGSPSSMFFVSQALRRRGHRTFGWGQGRNKGDVPALLPKVIERFEAVAERFGQPVVAVGWSLGGYLAREAARDRPDLVRKIITMGSPVVGGPAYTTTAKWYRARGVDVGEICSLVAERYAVPLEVPTVALYSKRDGVVAWQACIDEWSPRVRHVEVGATHLGMGISSEVLRVVVDEVR